jgi:Cof subfamily protein (haloacid dehalogenase superfamily)
MYRSVRRYLVDAGIDELVICYQGAAVVDPRDGRFLFHRPLSLEVAREAVEVLEDAGHPPNVYVDDELFVAEHTPYSRAYADFQSLPVTEVGDLLAWLDREPTKLVAVGDPTELPALRARLREHLGDRIFLTRSLPHLLELGHPSVSKGSGLAFVAEQLGIDLARIVAFGDGENDRELLEAAGFGFAVAGADPSLLELADATCEGPESEGVAEVLEAALDLLA